jgi:hypothetical protein
LLGAVAILTISCPAIAQERTLVGFPNRSVVIVFKNYASFREGDQLRQRREQTVAIPKSPYGLTFVTASHEGETATSDESAAFESPRSQADLIVGQLLRYQNLDADWTAVVPHVLRRNR